MRGTTRPSRTHRPSPRCCLQPAQDQGHAVQAGPRDAPEMDSGDRARGGHGPGVALGPRRTSRGQRVKLERRLRVTCDHFGHILCEFDTVSKYKEEGEKGKERRRLTCAASGERVCSRPSEGGVYVRQPLSPAPGSPGNQAPRRRLDHESATAPQGSGLAPVTGESWGGRRWGKAPEASLCVRLLMMQHGVFYPSER